MRMHVTENEELKNTIRAALKENDYYCPCVYNSKGKPEYKCPCEDFRFKVLEGQTCHCGLYIKDEL